MHSAKQAAIETIEKLRDDVSMDEIAYRLHLLSKVQQGVRDVDCGRVISTDQIAKEIESW